MMLSRRSLHAALAGVACSNLMLGSRGAGAQPAPSAAEIRAIAKQAYVYGFPMVDNYRIQQAYFVDRPNPEFKAPWNHLFNTARVFTPEDRAIQTPNSDTPYSFLGMDLRAEPLVLTVPRIEAGRYFSIQFIDAYTFNFDYAGSRTTGNGGGSFLVAGPRWDGATPEGVSRVFRCETELGLAGYRTQLFGAHDLDAVRRIQAGYRAEPLSSFLNRPAPPAAPAIDFVQPLTPGQQRESLEFFRILNFVLRFCPTHPSEAELMASFARIGVGAGRGFDPASLSPATRAALEGGIADAWQDFEALRRRMDAGEVSSGELFGTRAFLRNNYLYRMAAAVIGIYGNSREEAVYPLYRTDADGAALHGGRRYTLRFAPDRMPPVNAFWSLTMYGLPDSLLVANPLNRYLLNSPMLPQFQRDPDGGLTFHIQHESPGPAREANWLPAPSGPFFLAMRLYWPQPAALDGSWRAPHLLRLG